MSAVADTLESRCLLSASGTLTQYATLNGANGNDPIAVVTDSSGNLFGVTVYVTDPSAASASGEVFEIPAGTGTIQVLGRFSDPAGTASGMSLQIDSSGNLFGSYSGPSAGVVFEVPVGTSAINTIATFPNTAASMAGASSGYVDVVDSSDDLFGIDSVGNVFEIVHNSGAITYPFGTGTFAQYLTAGPDGNLYGTAIGGSIFQITLNNDTIQTLATVDTTAVGSQITGIALDASGNIWGFSGYGGPGGGGSIWELAAPFTSSSVVTLVDSFTLATGTGPVTPPVFGASGNLYGITDYGGGNDSGTLFELPAPSIGGGISDLADLDANATATAGAGIVTNSSGVAPDAAISTTGELSGVQLAPADTSVLPAALSVFGDAISGKDTLDGGGSIDKFVPDNLTPEQLKKRQAADLDKLQALRENQKDFVKYLTSFDVHEINPTVELQATQQTSRTTQLNAIQTMLAVVQRELNAVTPLANKQILVESQLSKLTTTLSTLNTQLATATGAAATRLQKEISADDATQTRLTTEDDTVTSTGGADLTTVESQEASIDSAIAAVPAATVSLSAVITTVPAPTAPGKRATAVITVTNNGNILGTVSMKVSLWARPDGTTGSADVLLGTVPMTVHLQPGASAPEHISFPIPKTLPAGSYSLVAEPNASSAFTGAPSPIVSEAMFTVL